MKKVITIGVIGHRDAIITKVIQQKIKQFFNKLWQKTQCPIILLSPLAIGADTAVAEIFLAQKIQTKRDYRLQVPLPMPFSDYQNTFSARDFIHFEALCKQADKVFSLPTTVNTPRRKQFRQGAKYIIESSQQTIVLWDGNPHRIMGGTADSVFYLQHGHYDDSNGSVGQPITWNPPLIIFCKRHGFG